MELKRRERKSISASQNTRESLAEKEEKGLAVAPMPSPLFCISFFLAGGREGGKKKGGFFFYSCSTAGENPFLFG